MDAREAERDVCVRAAVGLHQAAGPGESGAASGEDPLQLLFAGKEAQDSCLTVDGVFRLDAGQEKVLELARPQLALVPLGYSVSLLLWDPHGPGTQLPFQSIIWQVIDTIFQELEALWGDAQSLQTVSLVQVCSHDKAWDLLRSNGRALQVMVVTPLGLMVEEVMEIAVPDAQTAISVYAWGLGAIPAPFQGCAQQPPADGRSAVQGAGSLFTLTVERELEGGRHQRSALRILVSPGATGPCPKPAPGTGHPLPDAGCLPWIVERLLEGNSLTFLLLCVAPDTSRDEILAALGLAERVKGLAKPISATLWDPAQEITARRREIRGLRMELLAGTGPPEQKTAVAQLRRALWELKVLKSQRWEKKQAAAEVLGTSQMHQPSAKVGVSAEKRAAGQQPGTQTPLTGASLEPAGPERGDRHAPHAWVADMWARSIALHGSGASEGSQGGDSQTPASAGQALLEEPSLSKAPRPPTGSDTAGSWCRPCPSLEVQYALAKAQRQRLRAQHCLLLQRELGDRAGPGQEASREWDTARWQQEVAALSLSLEAARREREAAEGDLEALLQSHRQEMQACRQHLLQVLRDQQRLAEEQRDALDRWHRVLLQEALRDAAELATRNQQLRDARGLGSADATTQTP